MATYYSDQYRAIPTAATSSGAVTTTNTYEPIQPNALRVGDYVRIRATFATAIPLTTEKMRAGRIKAGQRVGDFSITSSAAMGNTNSVTVAVSLETTGGTAILPSGSTVLQSATTDSSTDAEIKAAPAATVDEDIIITLTNSCDVTGIVTCQYTVYQP
jgi:hypothetical protein